MNLEEQFRGDSINLTGGGFLDNTSSSKTGILMYFHELSALEVIDSIL